MTALAADKKTEYREGVEIEFLVKTSSQIYAGALVMADADGLLVPAADTASCVFQGVALQNVLGDGTKKCLVRREGVVKVVAAGMAQTNVGDLMYIVDDQTVGVAATPDNDVPCGRCVKVDSATAIWIDIKDRHVS